MSPIPQHLTFHTSPFYTATLSPTPSTPSEVLLHLPSPLHTLPRPLFTQTLLSAAHLSALLKLTTRAPRIALATTADRTIHLIPLHGLSQTWKPALDPIKEFHETYPGYVSSRSGPRISDASLQQVQDSITGDAKPAMDTTCSAPADKAGNLFARIVRGEEAQWRVWESSTHVAFLTPFGNCPGKTVVVPRAHLDSDVLGLPAGDLEGMMGAVWEVMRVLEASGLRPERVGLILEGMEIDWAHAKLVPVCFGSGGEVDGGRQGFVEAYGGSVSTLPGPEGRMEELEEMVGRLREAVKEMGGEL